MFRFHTLILPRSIPRNVVLALLLLAGCEIGARWMFPPDGSLRQMVEGYVHQLETERPAVWFCGNSTMHAGINGPAMEAALGSSTIKLSHGTATLHASVDMLEFYLEQPAPSPETLVVCTFKDDLNPHGYNARVSSQYDELLAKGLTDGTARDWLRLSSARNRILAAMQAEASGVVRRLTGRRVVGDTDENPIFAGRPIAAGDPFFTECARAYEIDSEGINKLARLAERHGIERTVVVLMPVTQAYVDFHNQMHPQRQYASIAAELRAICENEGIEFIDESGPWADNGLFKDPYHLNTIGSVVLTRMLADRLAIRTDDERAAEALVDHPIRTDGISAPQPIEKSFQAVGLGTDVFGEHGAFAP